MDTLTASPTSNSDTPPGSDRSHRPADSLNDLQSPLLTLERLSRLDIPARKVLLGDWFRERELCMIYGQTGRGKSLVAMTIALAIAGGGGAFEWEGHKPRSVLYLDAEMDVGDLKERCGFLWHTIVGGDKGAALRNLTFLSRHLANHQGAAFPDLVDPCGVQSLMEYVGLIRPKLIILDNLSMMAEVTDENDAAAMTPLLTTIGKLRAMECAVLLVHHTGKQEGKYRGSSKLAAPFETIIQLAENKYGADGSAAFTLKTDKDRSGLGPKSFRACLQVNYGKGRWVLGSGKGEELKTLCLAVRTRNYRSQKALALGLSLSTGEISKRKKKALQAGLITEEEWDKCLQGD